MSELMSLYQIACWLRICLAVWTKVSYKMRGGEKRRDAECQWFFFCLFLLLVGVTLKMDIRPATVVETFRFSEL